MPFYSPFNLPFFYNNYRYTCNSHQNKSKKNFFASNHNDSKKEKASEPCEAPEAFFEIFGLKLYFDDIIIMCILFFLYSEKVQDEELFICLILLLLS